MALADGFGENVWREVTHMEYVLQALTYPEIGKIIYTSGQNNTQKQISDFRSLIAQGVDVIIGFPDAGEAMLPSYRDATKKGIVVVPYTSTPGGTPGKDFASFVAEDLCQLGKNFAGRPQHAGQVGTGRLPRRDAGQRALEGLAGMREACAQQEHPGCRHRRHELDPAGHDCRRCPASSASTPT